jgi:hypothetical protein
MADTKNGRVSMPTKQRTHERASQRHAVDVNGWGYIDADERTPDGVSAEVLRELLDLYIEPGFWVEAVQELPWRPLDHLALRLLYGRDDSGAPCLDTILVTLRRGDASSPFGLTTHDLRGVRLGELYATVCQILEQGLQSEYAAGGPVPNPPMPPKNWATVFHKTPRPGRGGRDDLWYAQLAAAYVAIGSKTRVRDLAPRLHISESQLRNLLYETRRRGLLTSAPRGKAGGSLTEKAKELLDSTH